MKLIKRLYLRFLTARRPAPFEPQTITRVLCLRYDRIGDMIVSLPFIEQLKRQWPTLQIDILASQANAPIATLSPYLNHVFVRERSLLRILDQLITLRRKRYDIVADLNHAVAKHSIYDILCIAPKHVLSPYKEGRYGLSGAQLPLFDLMPSAHPKGMNRPIGDVYLDMLLPLRLKKPMQYRYNLGATSRANNRSVNIPTVLFNHAGSRPENTLNERQIVQILQLLHKTCPSHKILWSPSPELRSQALSIIHDLPTLNRVELAEPTPSIEDLIHLMENCELTVTPDTALVHLACALKMPLIAFYGGSKVHNIQWQPVSVAPFKIFEAPERSVKSLCIEGVAQEIREFLHSAIL